MSANTGESEIWHKADTWNSASTADGNTADSMDKNDICWGTSSDGYQDGHLSPPVMDIKMDIYLLRTWREKQIREKG